MKLRVKATGEIVEIIDIDFDTLFCNNGDRYTLEHLESIESEIDYWEKLKHQYAGMAMQGLLSNPCIIDEIDKKRIVTRPIFIAEMATAYAHALVQKLKEKEEK